MPPTEVRPQTFAVLQQPDSDSPSVRFFSEQNTLFNFRPSGMFKPIALLAYPSLPTFLRRCESNAIFDVRLSVPVVWVGLRPKVL